MTFACFVAVSRFFPFPAIFLWPKSPFLAAHAINARGGVNVPPLHFFLRLLDYFTGHSNEIILTYAVRHIHCTFCKHAYNPNARLSQINDLKTLPFTVLSCCFLNTAKTFKVNFKNPSIWFKLNSISIQIWILLHFQRFQKFPKGSKSKQTN